MSLPYVFGASETQIKTVSIEEALGERPRGKVKPDAPSDEVESELKIIKNQYEKRKLQIEALQQRQTVPELIIMENTIGLFSEKELMDVTVAEVTNTKYSGEGSVNDPRAGVIDGDLVCHTCHLDNFQCPGHLLRMKIARIYHPFYLKEVIHLLQSVCRSCSRLYMTESQIKDNYMNIPPLERLAAIAKDSEDRQCTHNHDISHEQKEKLKKGKTEEEFRELMSHIPPAAKCKPKVIYVMKAMKEKYQVYFKKEKSGEPQMMPIKEVYAILSAIPDEQAKLLGFEGDFRPKDIILDWIPVTPPITRTPIPTDGVLTQHKTTEQYIKIKKIVDSLVSQEITKTEKQTRETRKKAGATVEQLFDAVKTLFTGSNSQVFAGFKQFKSFRDLIQGKEGAIRNLLMGKRGNMTARTVLSPDPTLRFGQMRIPKKMAPYLTPKEIVCQYNKEKLESMLPQNLAYLQKYSYLQLIDVANKHNVPVPETISYYNQIVHYEKTRILDILEEGSGHYEPENPTVDLDLYIIFIKNKLSEQMGKSAANQVDSLLMHSYKEKIEMIRKEPLLPRLNYQNIQDLAERFELGDLVTLVDGIVDTFRQELLDKIINKIGHEEGRITHIIRGKTEIVGDVNLTQVVMNPKKPFVLNYGDQVLRWLRNGDRIVFNRQPTLHKNSIMAYEVVLGDDDTIGLHPSYTTPHNADFDGDEGALYGLMTYDSIAEAAEIMNVTECIMTASENKNIMGLIIDNITAAYKLTDKETKVSASVFLNCIAAMTYREDIGPDLLTYLRTGKPDLDEHGHPLHPDSLAARLYAHNMKPDSGRSLFSALLPYDFFYQKDDVLIADGVLVSGRIDKSHVGPYVHRSIIQMIHEDYIPTGAPKPGYRYGKLRTIIFMTDAPFLLNSWLSHAEQTVSIENCIFPLEQYESREKRRDAVINMMNEKKLTRNQLTPDQILDLDMVPRSLAERQIAEELENIKEKIQSYGPKKDDQLEEAWRENQIVGELKSLKAFGINLSKKVMKQDNDLGKMVGDIGSGAKGSAFQVAQTMGFAGQQFYRGQRPKKALTHGTRMLPHFPRGSDAIESQGFIKHSFFQGFTPAELFAHMLAGREGLIDIANNTGASGYMHRRTVKALENVIVKYDGSIRNRVGTIFQPVFGGDGFDAARLISVKKPNGVVVPFFIDLKNTVGRLNGKYGFTPKHESR
jgi:DNA-directed RNA polymerase beta' subunit